MAPFSGITGAGVERLAAALAPPQAALGMTFALYARLGFDSTRGALPSGVRAERDRARGVQTARDHDRAEGLHPAGRADADLDTSRTCKPTASEGK